MEQREKRGSGEESGVEEPSLSRGGRGGRVADVVAVGGDEVGMWGISYGAREGRRRDS